jgi:type VI protein secretion system component VasK
MNDGLLPRILAAIVGVLVLVASFFVGVVVFLIAVGVAVLGWLAMMFRVWRARRAAQRTGDSERQSQTNTVVDGEYQVVQQRERKDD